ncbi:hypothetical protein DPMN_042870 [Dreissena polymorpha]|uniref:Uncharacterized protein n=1 Tax=Dreissena polymorpha TaxID=45954 RepID=A0A9D4CZW7_DREPO|nr:hypothetical protein DPMN_042870 [Dreissena polymorpha]
MIAGFFVNFVKRIGRVPRLVRGDAGIQRDLNSFTHLWNFHRIRQQRHVEAPNGIPMVMYYQTEAYGTRDFSFRLPCELETIDRIQERYFVKKPHFGCKDDFIPVLEHVCV